jgi:hypothetical protein
MAWEELKWQNIDADPLGVYRMAQAARRRRRHQPNYIVGYIDRLRRFRLGLVPPSY